MILEKRFVRGHSPAKASISGALRDSSVQQPLEARRHAGAFADWIAKTYLSERMIIDVETCSLILDDDRWIDLDPRALSILAYLHDHCGRWVSSGEISTAVKGCKGGEKKIRHTLSLLPEEIREWIKGESGKGRRLRLPE